MITVHLPPPDIVAQAQAALRVETDPERQAFLRHMLAALDHRQPLTPGQRDAIRKAYRQACEAA